METGTIDANNVAVELHVAGRLDEAEAAYLRALESDPASATAHNNLGFLLGQRGQWEDAIARYDRALELEPGKASALTNLGIARAALGDLQGGLDALRRAAAADGSSLAAWDSLARLALAAGRLDEAEAAWRRALQISEGADRLTSLGSVVAARGRTREALNVFSRAIDLDPECARAWIQMGVVLFSRRDFGSAGDALRRGLALSPDDMSARRHLFLNALACGQRDDAERQLDQILRLDPEHVESIVDRAILDLDRGMIAAAMDRLDRAASIDAENPRLRYYRAVTLERMGLTDDARRCFEALAQESGKYARQAARQLAQPPA